MQERRTQVAAKLEGTEGTAEALAAADALLIKAASFTPEIMMNERPYATGSLSPFSSVPGMRSAKLEFDVALVGSGTPGTPPEFGDLLKACGFEETIVADTSVTYTPISDVIPSLTLGLYEDNTVVTKLWGARGNVQFPLVTGEICWAHFAFTGADFSVVDGVQLSGMTYNFTVPQPFINASFSIGGYSALCGKITVDMGNTVELTPNSSTPSGYVAGKISDRKPTLSIDPEKVAVASHDFYGRWRSGATGALSAVLGSTAGNICTITAPAVQYTKIGESTRNSLRTLGIDCLLCRNTSAGDDELSIAFT